MVAIYRGNSYETNQKERTERKTKALTYRGVEYKTGKANG